MKPKIYIKLFDLEFRFVWYFKEEEPYCIQIDEFKTIWFEDKHDFYYQGELMTKNDLIFEE